jgi:serine/threonine-protein kinase HipA
MAELQVWLNDQWVGLLVLEAGALRFRYQPDWLQQTKAVPLSQTLPLQAAWMEDAQCRPFFAGLLPEGQLRRLIAQRFQISGENDFGLLEAIGGDCAGAISLQPANTDAEADHSAGVEWLDDSALSAVLGELPQRPMLAGADGLRLSLAGAQDKLPVVVAGERIGLPRGQQPSTHILKPAIEAVNDSVHNEAFCMALIRAIGMSAADTEIRDIGGQAVLLVRRYDRIKGSGGQWIRLHQEDFCQALGVDPRFKYQNEGGPDLEACFSLLRRSTRPSAPQLLRLLDAVIVNALIGNHDAHAKNFSLSYVDGQASLTPLYDVLCTAVYPNLTAKMAMKIGSKYRFNEVQQRHWEQFAEAAGLSPAQTKKRILQIAEQLPEEAARLQHTAPFSDKPVVTAIVELIQERVTRTRR